MLHRTQRRHLIHIKELNLPRLRPDQGEPPLWGPVDAHDRLAFHGFEELDGCRCRRFLCSRNGRSRSRSNGGFVKVDGVFGGGTGAFDAQKRKAVAFRFPCKQLDFLRLLDVEHVDGHVFFLEPEDFDRAKSRFLGLCVPRHVHRQVGPRLGKGEPALFDREQVFGAKDFLAGELDQRDAGGVVALFGRPVGQQVSGRGNSNRLDLFHLDRFLVEQTHIGSLVYRDPFGRHAGKVDVVGRPFEDGPLELRRRAVVFAWVGSRGFDEEGAHHAAREDVPDDEVLQ